MDCETRAGAVRVKRVLDVDYCGIKEIIPSNGSMMMDATIYFTNRADRDKLCKVLNDFDCHTPEKGNYKCLFYIKVFYQTLNKFAKQLDHTHTMANKYCPKHKFVIGHASLPFFAGCDISKGDQVRIESTGRISGRGLFG